MFNTLGNSWYLPAAVQWQLLIAQESTLFKRRYPNQPFWWVDFGLIGIELFHPELEISSLPCTDVNVPALPAKCWTFEANCSHVLHPIQNERPIGYCYSYDYIMLWSGIELGKAICCSMFNYSFPHHLLACVVSTGALGQLWSLQLKPI